MAEAPGRLQVEYFDGSNWIALTSGGESLVLGIEIDDKLYSPQMAKIKVADLKDNGIFAASSTNSVLKEFMNIRVLDPAKYIIYFSGKIFRMTKKYEVPYGEVIEAICYDPLYSLGNEFLDSDSGDDDVELKSSTLISTWIGNHISTSLLSVTNDSGDVDRFETSSVNRANTSNPVKAGRSQMSVLEAILQEALQDKRLTALDQGYVYYVDPNFTSTATSHNPAGFLNYYARNRMPAREAGTSGDALPSANGLTIERPSGGAISETGQKQLMMSQLEISSASRELVTDIIASYYHNETGKRVSKRFSIIHYTALSGMAAAQYNTIAFDADVGTGGTNISNLVDSGNNVIGRIQYMSVVAGGTFPGFMILSDRTSHALVAGETLYADSSSSGITITLSSVATIGSQYVYEPKAVWGVTKTIKSRFNKESNADEIRTKLAGIFEGRQNVPDRLSFATSQLPYYWAEGRATSSTTGATLHDSAVEWEIKGVRTGASLLKLSGSGGTVAAYGYVSSLTDAGVITCTLNTGSWAVNDYYRWQVRVRAGHQVYIKCVPKGIAGANHIVTRIRTTQNMSSQTVTTWETQGSAARSIPTELAESTASAATHSAVDTGASAPVSIGDVAAKYVVNFSPGAKTSPDGTRHLAMNWTQGLLNINDNLTIDGVEKATYVIAANDTTTANGGALTAGGTKYVLYFEPDESETELKIMTSAAWSSADRTKLKIGVITTGTDSGGSADGATTEAQIGWDTSSSTVVIEGPASTEESVASLFTGEYFAIDGIQAKHMLTIGSDLTADERFKFFTPAEPANGSTSHWFRGFTGASVSDTTGKWFEFDVANKAFNLYSGVEASKLLAQFTGTALTFFDGSSAGVVLADKLSEFTTTGLSFFNNSNGNKLSMFDGAGAHIYDGTTATPGSSNELVTLNAGGLELHDFATDNQGAGATLEFFAGASASMAKLFVFQSGVSGTNELHFTMEDRTGTNLAYNLVVGAQSNLKESFIKPLWDGLTYLGQPSAAVRTFKQLGLKEGLFLKGTIPTASISGDSFGDSATDNMLYQNSDILYWDNHRLLVMDSAADSSLTDYWVFDVVNSSSAYRKFMYPSNATSDGTVGDSYSYIGSFDNGGTWTARALTAVQSYYFWAGDGSNSGPAFSFSGDSNTGFYRIASGHTGYSDDGTLRVNFGGHTFATTDSSGASTVNPDLSVAGSGAFSSYLYVGELRPVTDNVSDIGTSTRRFDNIYATNSTISTSDIRAKENISPSTLGLDFINDLNPVSYKWIDKREGTDKPDQTHYGIIAQEVIETLKKYGIDSLDDFGGIHRDGESYYGARYQEFIPILMKAVQELSEEVKDLKEKN